MTFLTICQEVHDRLGMQGSLTSVDTSGYQKRIVDMVSDAWRDIQSYRKDFYFLRTSKTLTVSAGVQTYQTYTSGASNNALTSGESARFGHWGGSNFIYNRTNMIWYTYDSWLRMDTSGAVDTPTKFAIDDSTNNLELENLSANKNITITWYKAPQVMTADSDTPDCPAEHHQIVVWGGLKNASNFFGNSALYNYAIVQYDKALGALMRAQIPSTRVRMRPLA